MDPYPVPISVVEPILYRMLRFPLLETIKTFPGMVETVSVIEFAWLSLESQSHILNRVTSAAAAYVLLI